MSNHTQRIHQPRVAELVANRLRQRILEGEYAETGLLPTQDALLAEFGTSLPSLREALRILEAEGLIAVRRGSLGGASVHPPRAEHAAYTLALVLQSGQATLGDVAVAIRSLEADCAALCAGRPDRTEQVVPRLEACNRRLAEKGLDDEDEFFAATSEFHDLLPALCGNATMALVAGSLEALWVSHAARLTEALSEAGRFVDRAGRERTLAEHESIVDLLRSGDASGVSRCVEHHRDQAWYVQASDVSRRVDAAALRTPGRTP